MQAAFRPPRKRLKSISSLGGRAVRERTYAILIYYLVYFPLILYMERSRDWHPLHASAVAWPEGAVILAGLGGVGKSTLTLALLRDPLARLLSENLILHDQKQVYAFPEPIHLDAQSLALLGDVSGRISPTNQAYSHNRQSYELPTWARVESAKPCLACFLCQGKESGLSPLGNETALEMILSADLLARELNEYSQQAAAFDLISPGIVSVQRRIAALKQLLASVVCYNLTVRPGEDLAAVVSLVQRRLT